ncbi:MFS transporter [Priestia abyssalis]|uniref:MFS transporter n=1 Tax=Priestia abyssalis TaxID=1221450 RepID=UPI0009949325|nr:MFS transporter [Priestia abyssalis]
MKINNMHLWILVMIVGISGFSQGMLLPVISIIFEQSGISSSLNGLHATALYIGILLASPFMEHPLRKYGYKSFLLYGGMLVIICLFCFPLWKSFWFWFLLRLFIGIGDHALHFGTQTWITSSSASNQLGRNMSYYGISFGLGFALGPSIVPLLHLHSSLPFIITGLTSLTVWCLIFLLKNEYPAQDDASPSFSSTARRFGQVMKYAWISLLLPFCYGFLEASLHGNFPVYALRKGIAIEEVSIILPAFAFGSIVSQLPLGILSDKYGRRNVLVFVLTSGFLTFLCASFVEQSTIGLVASLFTAGMLVGSTFSLGISYMTDLLPKHLLPAGNLMCGMAFGIGSIIGPFIGGLFIEFSPNASFFYVISLMLLFALFALQSFKQKKSVFHDAA